MSDAKQSAFGKHLSVNSRIPDWLHTVDALRALSILYIVGVWHLLEYPSNMPPFRSPLLQNLTVVCLGVFVFISGLVLGGRKVSLKHADFKNFYLRRLLRIYPLYLVALFIFVFAGLTDGRTAVASVFGLSMFLGPAPYTLWFVAMLLLFYVLAPLLISQASNTSRFLAIFGITWFLFGLAGWLLPNADKRPFIYFPVFAAGLIWSRLQQQPTYWWGVMLGGGALLVIAADLVLEPGLVSVLLAAFVALLGATSVYVLTDRLLPELGKNRTLQMISYASFGMYLFHRPIFGWMVELVANQALVRQLAYLCCVCLPVVILVAWLLQRAYNGLLSHIDAKLKNYL